MEKPIGTPTRVALVVMPFANADRPNLAVGLLQAGLKRIGVECDAKYFNLTFSRLLGPDTYRFFPRNASMTAMAGEWVFSQVFYGPRFSSWESYESQVLNDSVWGISGEERPAIRAALEAAPLFLRLAFESNDWGRYDLVGFTSTFEQTMASLCLARMIRQAHPQVALAVGGANFEAGMARPYAENYDFLDFVATGEADESLPALCRSLRRLKEGQVDKLEVPPGFLYRQNGNVTTVPPPADRGFIELDGLATPDYDDFFRVSRAGNPPVSRTEPPLDRLFLPVETSRGCWWGEKAHCTFCGLNGAGMTFRRKSWQRVVAETDDLARRYGAFPLQFVDNILAMSYFTDLLPYWAERPTRVRKFFEVKSNLRRHQIRLLRDSGVTDLQAGIESLSDGTLRLMRKGVSGAQNVALLRWCVELGVEPAWNVIYGFPGEDLDEYEAVLDALRKLTHLPSPAGSGPIRLDRFSPNYTRWREHGFTSIEPLVAYRHVFPFAQETLADLAYYFQYDHPQLEVALHRGAAIDDLRREWKTRSKAGTNGELMLKPHWQGGMVLVDSRYNLEPRTWRLSDLELALLVACDGPTSEEQVIERVSGAWRPGERSGGPRAVQTALTGLLERSVVVELGGALVNLALLPEAERLADGSTWLGTPPALTRVE